MAREIEEGDLELECEDTGVLKMKVMVSVARQRQRQSVGRMMMSLVGLGKLRRGQGSDGNSAPRSDKWPFVLLLCRRLQEIFFK